MKKAITIIMLVVVLMVSTVLFVACNKKEVVVPSGNFLNDVSEISTRPADKTPLLSAEETLFLQKVAENNEDAFFDIGVDSAGYDNALQRAAMLLYDTANASRINNDGLSLMVQDSLGGNEMGRVYMHGFTLQSGDKWYYQLVSQAAQGDVEGFETLAELLSPIAGNLQVAFTNGDNKYHYAYIMGSDTQLDCSVPTFPYASFIIPEGDEPVVYDGFEAYQAERNCRDSQLELTNMRIVPSLLNDDISVEYNEEEKFYTLKFSINCEDQSSPEFKDFERMSKLDLDTGTFLKINNTIVGWRAEVEIWDNGYAKAFRSYEDWKMRVIGNDIESHPKNKFEYLWKADEIMSVVSQDERFKAIAETYPLESDEELIVRAIEFYSDPQSVYVFDWFTFWIALGASIVGAIIIVIIVLAILVKVGKAPKLAAALKRMAQKDRERRQAIKEQDIKEKEKKKELKAEKKGVKAEKKEEKREAKAEKKNETVSTLDNADYNDSITDLSDNSVDSDENNL